MCTSRFPIVLWKREFDEVWQKKFFSGQYLDECADQVDAMVRGLESYGYIVRKEIASCGYCQECRLAKSRAWANRCVMEASTTPNPADTCFFLTLTYSDAPVGPTGAYTLDPDHTHTFMNTLRKHYERRGYIGIRYYLAGEYGGQTMRPHYHAIVFGLPVDDLVYFYSNKFGNEFYTSELLTQLWHRGFLTVSSFNWTTAAYVARYCMKKLYGTAAVAYEDLGIVPEFSRCSRRPGIGREFYELHKGEIYAPLEYIEEDQLQTFYDKIVLPSKGKSANIVTPPKYFNDLYREEDPEAYELITRSRKFYAELADSTRRNLIAKTDRDYYESKARIIDAKRAGMYRNFLKNF